MSKESILKFLNEAVLGDISENKKIRFLENFTLDKISPEDVAVFVDFMRKNMKCTLNMPDAIDVCGTGGSGLPRINTSTIASFILAELGVKVAKHGNKAASGRFGSFDLLEKLGIDIEKSPEELENLFQKKGLAFIYARSFHPIMKHFADARKAICEPTIFNIVGPLLNPADPKKQIIGTSFKKHISLIAEACKLLNKSHVFVVSGSDGLDEITLTGETKVCELKNGVISEFTLNPSDFGVQKCDAENIYGGDMEKNLLIAKKILRGEDAGRRGDLVCVNASLALKLAGVCNDLKDGFRMAKEARGYTKLEAYMGNILNEIASSKILTRSDRSFYDAIAAPGVSVIAEIKKASPSAGEIFKGFFDAGEIARMYEKNGASGISVLTDEKYFQGSYSYMIQARNATKKTPILCKDFIVHEYQIFQARDFGADAILLIASLLDRGKIQRFLDIARDLGMDVLLEIHNEDDLLKALSTDARIIGINNRDLKTFSIDLKTTARLSKMIPKGRLIVSESGIKSREDIKTLGPRVDAVLIGTLFMSSKNVTNRLHEIT